MYPSVTIKILVSHSGSIRFVRPGGKEILSVRAMDSSVEEVQISLSGEWWPEELTASVRALGCRVSREERLALAVRLCDGADGERMTPHEARCLSQSGLVVSPPKQGDLAATLGKHLGLRANALRQARRIAGNKVDRPPTQIRTDEKANQKAEKKSSPHFNHTTRALPVDSDIAAPCLKTTHAKAAAAIVPTDQLVANAQQRPPRRQKEDAAREGIAPRSAQLDMFDQLFADQD